MKKWNDIAKNLALLTQFGLSLITPLLLCLGICWYLENHGGLGGWVYIPGLILGLGGSGTYAWKFWRSVEGKQAKKPKKGISFNRHD